MIEIDIPGYKSVEIKNVVLDFNGTIAEDGVLIDKVKGKIRKLSDKNINIYVLTADTFGTVSKQCRNLPVKVEVFDKVNAAEDKKKIVGKIGADKTVSIGNGKNDILMFKKSVISVAVIGKEGCFSEAIFNADIVVKSPVDALDLLLNPNRLKATLRS